jgi:hypothetical protein
MVLAYYHNKGLPTVHINLERLIRIWECARVTDPVRADVSRIEAACIGGGEDVMVSAALGIRIDRHTLS